MSCPRLCFVRYVTVRNVSMTNEMHNSYKQFLFHSTLSALHVSNESSHSSAGARRNILYYTVQSVQSCLQHDCITQYNRYNRAYSMIVPIVLCNTVYYAVILMMND